MSANDDLSALDGATPSSFGVQPPGGLFAQSVGQALRRNPVAPDVPCHRCVRTGGSLGGFSGHRDGPEIDRKASILRSEGVLLRKTSAWEVDPASIV